MPATIRRLATRPERLKREQAAQLKGLLQDFPGGLPERALGELFLALDRCTAAEAGEWPFVMLSPERNAEVVLELAKKSRRPKIAMQLWALLFQHLRRDTGEILRSRDELAEALGVEPGIVSRIMTELEALEAISRVRQPVRGMQGPGPVRYFMNPRVGTHLSGEARRNAQAEAPQLTLVE